MFGKGIEMIAFNKHWGPPKFNSVELAPDPEASGRDSVGVCKLLNTSQRCRRVIGNFTRIKADYHNIAVF